MATTKPDLTRVWANGAPPANVVDPDTTTPGKVLSGWEAEVPPFEHFNFLQKWFTQGLAHFNEQGIGVWDTDTTYPINGMAKGSDGEIYQSLLEQSGNDPVADDGTNWFRLPIKSGLDTYDILTDLTSSKVKSGQFVLLKGRVSIGDGGHSLYIIKTLVEFGATPDELVTHSIGSNLVAVPIISGSLDVKVAGAICDGVADDTASFHAALAYTSKVSVPPSVTCKVNQLVIDESYRSLMIDNSSKLLVDTSSGTVGVTISGSFSEIVGGQIETDVAAGIQFIVSLEAFSARLLYVTVNDPSKSNYVGDGVNIPYNRGCVRVNQPFCIIDGCNIYFAEGAGVWNYREETKIINSKIHDNITGIVLDYGGSFGFGDNVVVKGNSIYANNAGATLHMSGADGILSVKTTKGHSIVGNQISDSGEHGTYIQSTLTEVVGNTCFDNPGSGLKFGGGFNSTCQGNTAYGNCQGINPGIDDADFYFQSPYGNVTISGNVSRDSASFGIRVVWIEGKAVAGEEARVVISDNIITNSSAQAIRASSTDALSITGNVTDGTIMLGQSTTNYPTTINAIISGNVADTILLDKSVRPLIKDNIVETLNIGTSANNVIVDNNKINAQSSRIPLQSIKEFNRNYIEYPEINLTDSLFEQGANAAANSKKRFIGNVFNSGGARFIYFTSAGISGDDNVWMDNELNGGVSQSVYTWGDNHQFVGNRETGDGGSLCFIRGTNCIITNNMGSISTENAGTHIIANNLVRV